MIVKTVFFCAMSQFAVIYVLSCRNLIKVLAPLEAEKCDVTVSAFLQHRTEKLLSLS